MDCGGEKKKGVNVYPALITIAVKYGIPKGWICVPGGDGKWVKTPSGATSNVRVVSLGSTNSQREPLDVIRDWVEVLLEYVGSSSGMSE